MTIKDLGRWESLEMVQRYTRSVTFHDSLKFYKAHYLGMGKTFCNLTRKGLQFKVFLE